MLWQGFKFCFRLGVAGVAVRLKAEAATRRIGGCVKTYKELARVTDVTVREQTVFVRAHAF
jgi:hypothetical protein